MIKSNKSKIIQAVLCCILWSTAIPVLKVIYSELNMASNDFYGRLVLAGMRFLLAGLILFVFYIITKGKIPKIQSNLITGVVIFALLSTTLQYLFFYTGVMNADAIKGVLLDSVKPLLIVILAHFFNKNDRINIYKIFGLCLGFAGIIVANLGDIAREGLSFNMTFNGEGMLLLASVASAIAVIYGKKIMTKIHYLPLNVYQLIIGSMVLLTVGLVGAGGFTLRFTPLSIVLLIYSGALSSVVFVIWYKLISQYKSSSISVFLFLIPVAGSIISSIVFPNESITIGVVVSLVLLTIGIILVNYDKETEHSTDT